LHATHTPAVVLSSPINLSEVDKLEALRRLDQFRPWRFLDEKRYCLVCGKIITGEQIQVTGGTRGNGALPFNTNGLGPSDRRSSGESCPAGDPAQQRSRSAF